MEALDTSHTPNQMSLILRSYTHTPLRPLNVKTHQLHTHRHTHISASHSCDARLQMGSDLWLLIYSQLVHVNPA